MGEHKWHSYPPTLSTHDVVHVAFMSRSCHVHAVPVALLSFTLPTLYSNTPSPWRSVLTIPWGDYEAGGHTLASVDVGRYFALIEVSPPWGLGDQSGIAPPLHTLFTIVKTHVCLNSRFSYSY